MVAWWPAWAYLGWAYLQEVAGAFCPPGCTCDDAATPSARCVGVGINMVPILLNPGLRRLNLAHNAISTVGQALVFLDQLQELDLSYNLLSSLGKGNFVAQTELSELRLAHNNLTFLSAGAFRGLRALVQLDLGHNSLSDLPGEVLDDLPHLAILHLAHNRLHLLNERTFRGVRSSLMHMDLCDNYFRHAPTTALVDLKKLQVLHLCRNRLTRLTPSTFPNPALTTLLLNANSIDSIDQTAFSGLSHLTKLNLNGNTLQNIPTEALELLISLEYLALSKNKIKTIGSQAFRGLNRLLTLEISRSPKLESLHPKALAECCGNLHSLIISHNPLLQEIPLGLLIPLQFLRILDLRSNSLQVLPDTELPWSSLGKLDVRGNPLVCNCSLAWLAKVLGAFNTSLSVPDVQCAAPEKLRGLYLSR